MDPKANFCHLDPYYLTNIYLKQNPKDMIDQLKPLLDLDPNIHCIMAGDFNFVESASDAPSPTSPRIASGDLEATWNQVTEHLQLKEVPQPVHTRYQLSDNPNNTISSRIDRVYINHSTTDLTLTNPTCYTPNIPHSIINRKKRSNSKHHYDSDHIPIILQFNNIHRIKHKHRPNISRTVAEIEDITEEISEKILDHHHTDPYQRYHAFTKTAFTAVTNYFKAKKKGDRAINDAATRLTAAIQLLKHCKSQPPNLDNIHNHIDKHPHLAPTINITTNFDNTTPTTTIHTNDLETTITNLIQQHDDDITINDQNEGLNEINEDFLPASTIPSKSQRNQSLFDEMRSKKQGLKPRLTSLRSNPHSDPTSDPKDITKIIIKFWPKLWKKRIDTPTDDDLNKYLLPYNNTIPSHHTPILPSLDTIIDTILKSCNSSTGPDGIPFTLLRHFADYIGQIILEILDDLANGNPPPLGFNFGLLHLFPKNHSLLIQDTRPITVSNTINRIIAKIITNAITPALQHILAPNQKGFIPGRQGADHITSITQHYYSSLDRKQQLYILFLDTAKAFDSIDHSFIFKMLHKINLPTPFINIIKCLLTDVKVFLTNGGNPEAYIDIERGVKQGCPLSPLLFALCYDVLLRYLSNKSSHRDYAFADDLAIAAHNLNTIISTLKIIHNFSLYSGLGLNIKKTTILTTMGTDPHHTTRLEQAGFGAIEFVDAATYLGVLVGRFIDTVDIYRKALEKFFQRLPVLLPPHTYPTLNKRILTANIYLLPLFYYLAQFYIIPYTEVVVKVKEALRKAIVPFNSSFAYAHLITPKKEMGPFTPLRDLWATNLSLLNYSFPLGRSHGYPEPQLGKYSHVIKHNWGSLKIQEHKAWAAWSFLYDYHKRESGMIRTHHIKGPAKKRRAVIYHELVMEGYWQPRASIKHNTSLYNRVSKHFHPTTLTPPNPHHILKQHIKLLGSSLSSAVWNTHFRLLFDALADDRRRLQSKMSVPTRHSPYTNDSHPCYFCGRGTDHISHYYFNCHITHNAFNILCHHFNIKIPFSTATILLLNPPTTHPLHSIIIVHFNWAVWHQRTTYFAALGSLPKTHTSINRIVNSCLGALPAGLGPTTGPGPFLAPKRDTQNDRVRAIAMNPPDNIMTIFTDGSATPNPGPCGGGLWARLPSPITPNSHIEIWITISLGLGDNNIGEMVALTVALWVAQMATIMYNYYNHRIPASAILSDSMGCVAYLTVGWPTPISKRGPGRIELIKHLSTNTRKSYYKYRKNRKNRIYWIRGHTDNFKGNDIADEQAKKAAAISKKNIKKGHPNLFTPECEIKFNNEGNNFKYFFNPGDLMKRLQNLT
jgi:ribonuclease HI